MKKTIILFVFISFAFSKGFSQDPEFEYYRRHEIRTLLGHNDGGGVYCALSAGYSEIENKQALMFGGRFGWMAGHSIGIGIGGTGFINEFHYEPSFNHDVSLAGGYGGIYLEPVLFPRSPVHLSFPVLFGLGGISFVSMEDYINEKFIENSQVFLIVEPAAELELNVTRFCRLAFGVTYRFPASFDFASSGIPETNIASIKGISYTMSMKFGKF